MLEHQVELMLKNANCNLVRTIDYCYWEQGYASRLDCEIAKAREILEIFAKHCMELNYPEEYKLHLVFPSTFSSLTTMRFLTGVNPAREGFHNKHILEDSDEIQGFMRPKGCITVTQYDTYKDSELSSNDILYGTIDNAIKVTCWRI